MNAKTLASGGVCIAVGGYFATSALSSLKVGSTTNMGPGFFPLLLAALLIALGLFMAVKSFVEPHEPFSFGVSHLPWRGIILIIVAPIFLGLTIRGLGITASVFLTALGSAFASRTQTVRLAFLVSTLLAVFCTVVFGLALKLPIPIIGPWLQP